MSRELEEKLLRGYELWNRGDFDAMLETFDPDVEIDATHRVLNPARYHGIDGLHQLTRELFDVWEEWRIEPTRFWWKGDEAAVVETKVTARGRNSGLRLSETYWTGWRVRDGRAIWMALFVDRDIAFETVGLGLED